MNYLTMCGMLAVSLTDPPALAFANNLHRTSGVRRALLRHCLSVGNVPRIITPQLLAVLFWNIG
ncbi:hypothetical protein ACLB1N_25045 [Escherichia coli]